MDSMEAIEVTTTEMHTGGEPLRVVQFGYPAIEGETILDKQSFIKENLDHLRKFLMFEPRGHCDMFGAVQVPTDLPDADAAFIFMHNKGYTSMCGHAVISLGRYCVDNKIAEYKEPESKVNIQCPCGLVSAYVQCSNGKTGSVRFESVPAFAVKIGHVITTPNYGKLKVDVAYGGAFYGFLPLSDVGLTPQSPVREITKAATEIKQLLKEQVDCIHPFEKKLSYFYGVIFTDDKPSNNKRFNLTIFADAAVDRSPCGSGTTARMALLHAKKVVCMNEVMQFENPLTKSVFRAQVVETTQYGEHNAVIVEVSGNGYYTGTATFTMEKDDPFRKGFLIS